MRGTVLTLWSFAVHALFASSFVDGRFRGDEDDACLQMIRGTLLLLVIPAYEAILRETGAWGGVPHPREDEM